ncbi:hypothetical protein HKX48_008728 [Thoreauomyces humboldtii]|nr:hypothetical protein HKX48_008728 [Thoreauomyces humboldtii]
MSSAYGRIATPSATPVDLPLPIPLELKKSRHATLSRYDAASHARHLPALRALLNDEISAGNTYPQEEELTEEGFEAYFLAYEAFVVTSQGDDDILGCFYVKPNFPGRCSHICNGGFIVAKAARGLGVGRAMGRAFLTVAPLLGYSASMFNLVFENNVASVALWRSLGFKEIGRLPKAGRLRKSVKGEAQDEEEFVDALMFYYEFAKDGTIHA